MTSRRLRRVGTVSGVRRQVKAWRGRGESVAFVPTMGYLHEGHLSLMEKAGKWGDRVVMSIFVNPTQFGPGEDFARYPRNLRRDLALARGLADLCFVPDAKTMYPPGHRTEIRVTGLEDRLEGAFRPGHFRGVAVIVQKLLGIVNPDILVLGQKDAQQAVILETMIRDLDLPVRVRRGSTVREKDGLAMSSRNVNLSPAERRAAPVLYRSLRRARTAVRDGERSSRRVLDLVRKEIRTEPRVRLQYAAAVDARSLEEVPRLSGRVLLVLAAHLGKTRLIDNVEFNVSGGRS